MNYAAVRKWESSSPSGSADPVLKLAIARSNILRASRASTIAVFSVSHKAASFIETIS